MSFSIQTNVNSMIAQENMRINSQFQTRTITRLTSGYRINSSADDAAGLAVANGFRDSEASLTQGVRNANDGISQLQIIDGGLSNISNMLDRLQTLATESASQTFTGDRATLNNEYAGLLAEIDRQADNIGLGPTNSANIRSIGVYIGGGQSASQNSAINVNLTNSGVGAAALGIGNTSVLSNGQVTVGSTTATQIAAGESAIFTLATTSGVHTVTITGSTGDTLNGQISELNTALQPYGIAASLNVDGKLQFMSANAFSVSGISSGAANFVPISSGTADTANNTGLNNFSFTNGSAQYLHITVNGVDAVASVQGGGTAGTQDADVAAINAALKAQGITGVSAVVDESTGTGLSKIQIQGAAAFTVGTSATAAGTVTTLANQGTTTQYIAMNTGGNPQIAIDSITAAIQSLGVIQGKVGTGENALNYGINLAQSQITNFSSAESQIRDADVAAEAANLTKAQILQQSSIAAMAQANSAPQAILKLLQ